MSRKRQPREILVGRLATPTDVAAYIGTSEQTVRTLCAAGKFVGAFPDQRPWLGVEK